MRDEPGGVDIAGLRNLLGHENHGRHPVDALAHAKLPL